MRKVFISYSHKNADKVIELYQRLKDDSIECFFDKVSIKWGDNFVTTLEQGIKDSDSILVCMSPDFFKSEWTELERTGAMAHNSGKKILPLLLETCGDLINQNKPLPQVVVQQKGSAVIAIIKKK